MNKKQFARVTSLYRDGVTPQVCITAIMAMSRSDTEAAIFIDKFYSNIYVWKKPINEPINIIRDIKNELSNGEKPSNLEDQRPIEDQ